MKNTCILQRNRKKLLFLEQLFSCEPTDAERFAFSITLQSQWSLCPVEFGSRSIEVPGSDFTPTQISQLAAYQNQRAEEMRMECGYSWCRCN